MSDYESQEINHLGIVAGICEEIGLTEKINEVVGVTERDLSVGEAVKGMIINSLGFVNHPLYLTPKFFEKKPVEVLIGPGRKAEDFTESSLGRALDKLYECGITETFWKVSSKAIEASGIENELEHLDSTSICFHGDYKEVEESEAVKITFGYSRDGRPDLKQVAVSLICKYKSSIPTWLEINDGNQVDKSLFPKIINEYVEQLNQSRTPYFIVDSALYSEKNITSISERVKWITRVPETISEAKQLVRETQETEMDETSLDGYKVKEISSSYGGIEQRWLVVLSEAGLEREESRLQKRIHKAGAQDEKKIWHLENKTFESQVDALIAVDKLNQKLKFRSFVNVELVPVPRYGSKGRPKAGAIPTENHWKVTGQLDLDILKVEKARESFGKFIIATNELDPSKISSEQMLSHYKTQAASIERGFRFLKDPMFFAHGLFLKKPERVMALLMIMGLSLLVYSLAERKLRLMLKEHNLTVPNQRDKPIENPTMRWIFQLFQGIHLLIVKEQDSTKQLVLNLKPVHKQVIQLLGHEVQKCYLLQN